MTSSPTLTLFLRYEFYFLLVKYNILLAALVRKILFLPLATKIHIFALPCNILYIIYTTPLRAWDAHGIALEV